MDESSENKDNEDLAMLAKEKGYVSDVEIQVSLKKVLEDAMPSVQKPTWALTCLSKLHL